MYQHSMVVEASPGRALRGYSLDADQGIYIIGISVTLRYEMALMFLNTDEAL